jgi:hypothetical protein
MSTPARVEIHPDYPRVITVEDVNGFRLQYLMTDGVLYPGRLWQTLSDDHYRVDFFLPMPDGPPTILAVTQL